MHQDSPSPPKEPEMTRLGKVPARRVTMDKSELQRINEEMKQKSLFSSSKKKRSSSSKIPVKSKQISGLKQWNSSQDYFKDSLKKQAETQAK